MLTAFRQLRRKFLNNGRIRNYLLYAAGEIVLVVIGILIALQINLLKESKAEHIKEEFYLERLAADMKYNQLELQRVLDKTRRINERSDSLIQHIYREMPLESGKKMNALIKGIAGYTVFTPKDATIDEIIASGNLELIRDEDIRESIITWKATRGWLISWEDFYKERSDEYMDILDRNLEFYRMDNDSSYMNELSDDLLNQVAFRNLIFDLESSSASLHDFYVEAGASVETILSRLEGR